MRTGPAPAPAPATLAPSLAAATLLVSSEEKSPAPSRATITAGHAIITRRSTAAAKGAPRAVPFHSSADRLSHPSARTAPVPKAMAASG